MSFDSLGLAEPLLRAVHEQGYTIPTPIQAQAIPAVLSGGDLLAGAQTGTGKTAGFTLPMLQRLSQKPAVRDAKGRIPIRALILTPTRELAAQVEESVRTYGKYLKLSSMVMFGGVGMQPQVDRLRKGVDILVATPGRLLDHHQQRTLDLSQVEIFVLDEADRMLDMGFIHDIKKVLAIKPALIEVARRNQTADNIAQKVHPVGREMKKDLLVHLIQSNDWHQVLVFTRMKHGANRLVEHLVKQGVTAMAIHGNKSQSARTKALADFKSGDLRVLVATDIAARGIDIDQLPHVVNFELPNVPEDYVHRIGRTGRAGAQGEAVSLVCVDEDGFLRDIEKLIKREIPKEIVPGFAPHPSEKPEPIVLGRMVIGAGAGRGGHRNGGGGRGNAPARPRQEPRHDAGRSTAPARAHHGARDAKTSHAAPVRSGAGHAPHAPRSATPASAPRSDKPREAGKPMPRLTQPKR
jgi:ATP-dependent RNA helicase RhlE